MAQEYDYKTMSFTRQPEGVSVYGWKPYPRHSVLAGQMAKCFIDTYPDEAAALAAHPELTPGQYSSKWTEPQVSLSHLPDENDPVPGGMYPDDY